MSKSSDRRNATANRMTNAIVEELFVNGAGVEAERLVLEGANGRDLGGLCKGVVIDRVLAILKAGLKEFHGAVVHG